MSANTIVRPWRHCVATQLLPGLHGHHANALADFSFAAVVAGHCQAGRLALHTPTAATAASSARRFERLLANSRLSPHDVHGQLADAVLAPWAGRTLLVLLDETPKANDLRAMTLRVAYAKRALPLASVVYRPDEPPQPMPQLIRGLLQQLTDRLPAGATVVLLADRGLAWPTLVDWCTDHGWHYLLRLQRQTKVRATDGVERSACDLATRIGARWWGTAEVFKKAGWRTANVVATWEPGMKEPWLLVADQRASLRHVRCYGKRMWTEESFRDDKSSGFHWNESRVNDPAHAGRLLVVLALAMILAASLGSEVLKSGSRHLLDPHRRRRLSIVQLGLRWLQHAINVHLGNLPWLDRLYLYPK
jgi:hypothetical protein